MGTSSKTTMTAARGAQVGRLPDDEAHRGALALFTAMAHEGRLRALVALARIGPLSAGALAEHCRMEQTAMSHQLRILREAHLVTTERDGKSVIYALADRHIAHLVEDALVHAGEQHPRRRS